MTPKKNNQESKKKKNLKNNQLQNKKNNTSHTKIKISHILGWILIIALCMIPITPFIIFLCNLTQ
ncbi:hypothetical protein J8J04_01020 ['Fragaria x ananassa' phyllody phytoplasma]|uniref:Uncharacterized protein n=1 Tax='Fragaria x ananassa' phyllody phytoplasma TaxID=2358428 RepID=A0ABS5K340_9MOLU|nr:hypothetical protein ['Fragaria x ananassa' phyllody phytoplasma]MBS2126282.1 hypothetical protein ['Fragaria x ananassa' phyllody phytoplasma]